MSTTLIESELLRALKNTLEVLRSFPLANGFNKSHFCQSCWAPTPENDQGEAHPRIHRESCELNNRLLEAERLIARVEGRSETKTC
jgi:hypothetical protein